MVCAVIYGSIISVICNCMLGRVSNIHVMTLPEGVRDVEKVAEKYSEADNVTGVGAGDKKTDSAG